LPAKPSLGGQVFLSEAEANHFANRADEEYRRKMMKL